MIEAGSWDGLGSSIVGGFIGAVTVMLGAWLAYRYGERSRLAEREEASKAKAEGDRRNAANDLIIEISDLSDDACSRRSGLIGDYALFPLRNALFVTHVVLEKMSAYSEARIFYDAVRSWREWARDHRPPNPPSRHRPDGEYEVLICYQEELRTYAQKLINLLQQPLEDGNQRFDRPELPSLPE